jgi:hypothetical protein
VIDTAGAGEARSLLRQGLFVQGSLETGTAEPLVLPVSAVRTDKPQPYVQVLDNGRIAHRSVTLGPRGTVQGQPVVAVEGLGEGTQVVAGTVGTLREATPVQVNAARPAAAAN